MTTTTRTRKKTTPAPVALTPEQIAAQAARDARNDAYVAAREALLSAAMGLAERLNPGRVYTYGHISGTPDNFTVMFGPTSSTRFGSFRGPGLVELSVDLSCRKRVEGTDDFEPPTLRFSPRTYSLSTDDGLEVCEAQGKALLDAAALGRTLLALTSTAT